MDAEKRVKLFSVTVGSTVSPADLNCEEGVQPSDVHPELKRRASSENKLFASTETEFVKVKTVKKSYSAGGKLPTVSKKEPFEKVNFDANPSYRAEIVTFGVVGTAPLSTCNLYNHVVPTK